MCEHWTEPFRSLASDSKAGTGRLEGAVVDLRKILSKHSINWNLERTSGAELSLIFMGRLAEGNEWIEMARLTSDAGDPNHLAGQYLFENAPARQLRADLEVTTAGSGTVNGVDAWMISKE